MPADPFVLPFVAVGTPPVVFQGDTEPSVILSLLFGGAQVDISAYAWTIVVSRAGNPVPIATFAGGVITADPLTTVPCVFTRPWASASETTALPVGVFSLRLVGVKAGASITIPDAGRPGIRFEVVARNTA